MLLSKRLFPHPVMKKTPHDDYKTSFFNLGFEQNQIDSNEKIKLKNLQFSTNNDNFRNLVIGGKIKVYAHFECSNTLFRKVVALNLTPLDFEIDKKDLNGKLMITCFAIANEDMPDFYDIDFVDEYDNTHFDIDKYDILAFDDGFSIDIIHDIDKDDKISSIFMVIPKLDDQNDGAEYIYEDRKIIIKLPQLRYNQYDRLKYVKNYQNLFFSLFAVPILSMCLNDLKGRNFDELELDFNWFISIKNAYKKIYNDDLSSDEFEKIDTYVFAQQIFENPVSKTIDELYNNRGEVLEDQDEEN